MTLLSQTGKLSLPLRPGSEDDGSSIRYRFPMFGDEDGLVAIESSRVVFVYETALLRAIIAGFSRSDALNGEDGKCLSEIEEVETMIPLTNSPEVD